MITLAVDPSSEAFAQGRAIGTLLVAVAAAALVWRFTRSWRHEVPGRGPAAASPAPLAEAAEADARVTDGGADGSWARARRRQRIVLGVVAAIVALGVSRALSFEGEPPAARSGTGSAAAAGAEPGEGVPARVVEGPERVGEYRVLAGEDPLKGKEKPRGRQWYYDRDGDGAPDLMLGIDAVEWDPSLGAQKQKDTLDQELRNFFAGAKAQDVTPFDAGPRGGKLSCGTLAASGPQPVLCAWTDSETFGSVLLAGDGDLAGAAKTALAFRTAAERRG
ncbi:hypothetical protein [Streptomyces sp. NK15101]|uniref:hypothetical protein n=1 Tax=Streptomyces sp. NK15101 TaxID=2873261 RepID=UPI001CEC92F8|nr:hypothetical protein [Streptomyces sp. NK15101]